MGSVANDLSENRIFSNAVVSGENQSPRTVPSVNLEANARRSFFLGIFTNRLLALSYLKKILQFRLELSSFFHVFCWPFLNNLLSNKVVCFCKKYEMSSDTHSCVLLRYKKLISLDNWPDTVTLRDNVMTKMPVLFAFLFACDRYKFERNFSSVLFY